MIVPLQITFSTPLWDIIGVYLSLKSKLVYCRFLLCTSYIGPCLIHTLTWMQLVLHTGMNTVYMLNWYFGMNRLTSNDVDTCLVQGSRRSSTPMFIDDSIHAEASRDSDVCYSLDVLPFRVTDEVHVSPEAALPLGRLD